ncbi:SGNH/GDSL hydrolase family protein [Hoeflea prorocentri]|uniref:DUF459 domain-containing protein n=1 Tax=Hoeflea prorocentri TaxID=1922333 RepID=A0A9X3UH97_9HYPH|nr:DUF459 domain-containing protein [Hoeflea prorocentri]MCY6379248.1 DUF459 domain-containing protein [Hoeflea prorocentri]MDA5397049.1 DUF459 domain-containing protein [Hoeflea prorocentri]
MVRRLNRLIPHLLVLPLLAVFAMVFTVSLPVVSVEAQTKYERRSVLDRLFGPRRVRPEKTNRQRPRATIKRKKSVTRSAPKRSKKQQVATVKKLENARKILVVGDFMAKSLSEGLRTAFQQAPGVAVVRKTNGSSGLVRDDYYNWNRNLPGILDEFQPSIVIVMVGSNDRQEIRQSRKRIPVRSEQWVTEYTDRVDTMARAVRARNIPLIWVGAPSYKSSSMSADILAFNSIYRSVVEEVNGEYVDIWDGFVDADGKFVYTGSDIIGQQVRLRTSDGIRMTKAGKRKLAFYVEKSIRRLLGDDANEGIAKLTEENLPELLVLHPDTGSAKVRTSPISMVDPGLDGSDKLLGTETPQTSLTRTPRDDLVFDGKTSKAPPGRADHFVLPQQDEKAAAKKKPDLQPQG